MRTTVRRAERAGLSGLLAGLALFVPAGSPAQPRSMELIAAEYFWDADPGEGSGTAFAAEDGNLDEAVEALLESVAAPAVGTHLFSVRVKDVDNQWSPVFSTVVEVGVAGVVGTRELTMAEYFWDADPGEGSGTPFLAADGNLDEAVESLFDTIAAPGLGAHRFSVRVKDIDGQWSPVFSTVVEVGVAGTVGTRQLIEAEYFWGADPGEGGGTPFLAEDGNFDEAVESLFDTIAAPGLGAHRFSVRVRDVDGQWSPVFSTTVQVVPPGVVRSMQLVQAEYFWDADPGEGNGIPFLALDGSVDEAIEDLGAQVVQPHEGLHTFSVRVKDVDGQWSPVFTTVVEIVDPLSDLVITKTDGVTSATPGATVTYTIVASNAGPTPAIAVSVQDTFPGVLGCSWTAVEAGGATGFTAAGAGDLDDTLGLPAGSSVTYTVVCTIPADAIGTLSNTATIASGSIMDTDPDNDSATDDDTLLVPEADLSIVQSDAPDPVTAGQQLTYTLTTTNAGPSVDAATITVVDTLPPETSFVSASGAGWSCGHATGVVTCTRSGLGVTTAPDITIVVDVAPAAEDSITNAVSVSSSTIDPDSGANDTDVTEDTSIDETLDFGDAPDGAGFPVPNTYPTLLASNGARHGIAGPRLGATVVDVDVDGQPDAAAQGDDNAATDDEDGVVFTTAVVTCEDAELTVTAPDGGMLDAFVDFNRDGDWNDGGEQVFSSLALASGANDLQFTVPCDAGVGTSFARFRISTAGGLSSAGVAADGEVEDYALEILALDFGDLPDPGYPTLRASDGARHARPATGPILGTLVDVETEGQPDPGAAGDDLADVDDEDGLAFPTPLVQGASASFDVTVTDDGTDARLNAWIDFDMDGVLESPSEQVATDVVIGAVSGTQTVSVPAFVVPSSAVVGNTLARFRIASAGGLSPTGLADDGEVEDHVVTIAAAADLAVTKSDGVVSATPGETVTYTIVASNAGPSAAAPVSVHDNFPADLTCTWTSVAAGGATGNTASSAGDIDESLSLPVGGSVTYTAVCTIAADATGTLANTATISSPLADIVPSNDSATDDDTALVAEADLSVTKTDSPDPVTAGQNLTYTITASNAGPSDDPATVAIVDTLPAGTSFVSASGAGWTCNEVAGVVTCTRSGLVVGAAPDVTLIVEVDPSTTGVLMNTVSVSSPTTDPNPGANDTDVVEETTVEANLDFGDAPDGAGLPAPNTYPTLLSSDGARHGIAGPSLGSAPDADADGQPDAGASGDDGAGADDEDGVVFAGPLVACETIDLTIAAPAAGLLSAWIDFDRDGDWSDVGEQVFSSAALAVGANDLQVTVPCGAVPGATFARFRVSTKPGLSFSGLAPDGEVEDYALEIQALDFGDLPDPDYPTLLASDGARHARPGSGPILGTAVDAETDGQPNATATGDDLAGDDEDGVDFTTPLFVGGAATLDVTVTDDGTDARLNAWIDFDGDGVLESPSEQIATDFVISAVSGSQKVTLPAFAVPSSAVVGTTFARFRLDSAGGLGPTGLAADGEVEDYSVTIAGAADLAVAKDDGVVSATPGEQLTYTIEASNAGPSSASPATLSDQLPAGLSCDWTSIAAGGATGNTTAGSGDLSESLTLPPGSTVTYTAVCSIGPSASGTLSNTATISSSLEDPVPGNNSATDEDTLLVPEADLSVTQTDTPDPVMGGMEVAYTVMVANAGPSDDPATITVTDTLPAGASLVNASGASWSCGEAAGVVTCTRAGLLIANAPPISIVVEAPGLGGVITNTVSVSSPTTDPTPGANDTNVTESTTVNQALDFGDAPDGGGFPAPNTYPTLLSSDGARHGVGGPTLGAAVVDTEADGQPDAGATGDDLAGTDDEDGVVFTSAAAACETAELSISAPSGGLLDAWVDFNADGDWADAGEQIFASALLAVGGNDLQMSVPCGAVAGQTFARFRVSSAGGLSTTGLAPDGEVEDHVVDIVSRDFGDLPDPSYPTTFASDGARHALPGTGPILGTAVDEESDGQPDAGATGDDLGGSDDEDGVTFPVPLAVGLPATVDVTVTDDGTDPVLDAWIDFDGDGALESPSEQIAADYVITATNGTVTVGLPFTVPVSAAVGGTFARFRVSSAGGLSPSGLADDGEVEDYPVTIAASASLTITKDGTGTGSVTAAGIDCGDDCDELYGLDTVVPITAQADDYSVFSGWSGDVDCQDDSVTMDGDKTCNATFDCEMADLVVTDTDFTGVESLLACDTITFGPNVTIAAAANVTLRAGVGVIFVAPVTVVEGGTLTVDIDPSIATP